MKISTLKYIIGMLIIFSNYSCAQPTGEIDDPSLGISFKVPEGWEAQKADGGYMLTSSSTTGFMLVNTNNNSDMETMKAEARQGISDDSGNYLQLISSIEELDSYIIGAEYEGVISGGAVKAYIIGVANTQGSGISLMVAAPTNLYSMAYKQLCFDFANTINIYTPGEGEGIEDEKSGEVAKKGKMSKMETEFAGAKLSYYDSYSSGGYGSYSGYSSKKIIDLCEEGYFYHSAQSSMSVGSGGSSGGYGGGGNGAGTWKIIEQEGMKPILHLGFYSGTIYEYYLTFGNSKTYLDGKGYYRTYGEEGARCN